MHKENKINELKKEFQLKENEYKVIIYKLEDEKYILSVKDDGYGMPKDEIHKITEVFYMVDKSRSRKQGGAGLGMAISRKIAENYGAELWIDSVMGEGTIVKVSFERWKTLEAEL